MSNLTMQSCSNCLITALSKVLFIKIGQTLIKSLQEWCKFAVVCKQMAILLVHINKIGNNNVLIRHLASFHGLYFTRCLSWVT